MQMHFFCAFFTYLDFLSFLFLFFCIFNFFPGVLDLVSVFSPEKLGFLLEFWNFFNGFFCIIVFFALFWDFSDLFVFSHSQNFDNGNDEH